MGTIDPVQSSLYFTATAAAQNQAKKAEKKTARKKHAGIISSKFSDFLDTVDSERQAADISAIDKLPFEKALEVLKDDVDIAADMLKEKPYGESFTAFRQAVANFLKYTVDNAYRVEQLRSKRIQRRLLSKKEIPVVVQIQTINVRLDRLAGELLASHLEQIQLAAKVDEITGLLVDLLS